MNELRVLLQENLNKDFISAVLSNPRDKEVATKIKVRPLMHKDHLVFQVETFRNNQAFHENLEPQEACEKLMECMQNMKQMQCETVAAAYTVLVSKKGKVTIKKKAQKCENRKTPGRLHLRLRRQDSVRRDLYRCSAPDPPGNPGDRRH